jgi:hypothetical protein
MPVVPPRFGHYLYGVIQSGLTCAVATATVVAARWNGTESLLDWLGAWIVAWIIMLPVVLLAAPLIRAIVARLTT